MTPNPKKLTGDVDRYDRSYQSTYSDGSPILERVSSYLTTGEYTDH